MELCIQLGAKKEGIKDLLAVLIDDFELEPQQTTVLIAEPFYEGIRVSKIALARADF